MNHIGLFEGMGGFGLAAHWMGWKTIAWCEYNPFGQRILRYYFPKATEHHDIRDTDFTIYRGRCDIITGGFPCQPFSQAGARKGAEDDRFLWPEMLRAIKEVRPAWVVGENVAGIESMVFPPVQTQVDRTPTIEGEEVRSYMEGEGIMLRITTELEEIGYSCQPLRIPAASIGAPHKRDRWWFIANANER